MKYFFFKLHFLICISPSQNVLIYYSMIILSDAIRYLVNMVILLEKIYAFYKVKIASKWDFSFPLGVIKIITKSHETLGVIY